MSTAVEGAGATRPTAARSRRAATGAAKPANLFSATVPLWPISDNTKASKEFINLALRASLKSRAQQPFDPRIRVPTYESRCLVDLRRSLGRGAVF